MKRDGKPSFAIAGVRFDKERWNDSTAREHLFSHFDAPMLAIRYRPSDTHYTFLFMAVGREGRWHETHKGISLLYVELTVG